MSDWIHEVGASPAAPGEGARPRATPRATLGGAERYGAERFGAHRPADAAPAGAAAALLGLQAGDEGAFARARAALWMVGGAASLVLVGAMGIWGYKLVLRDVLGVPVVEAAEGPMRLEPAEPGGATIPNQGLAVNAVAGVGEAAPPSDVLTLAPATPGLAQEDLEVVQTAAEEGEVRPAVTPGAVEEVEPVVAELRASRPMTAEEVLALADRIAGGADPLEALAAVQPAPAVVQAAVLDAPTPALAGPGATLRPPPRPRLASAPAAPEAAPATAPAAEAQPIEVALAGAVPAGTALVQLGAFDSPEIAASEWVRLDGDFRDFMGGKERVIQEAVSGGRTFYRLRAMGFEDLADARRFCAVLVAEDAGCIPVVTRE